MSKDFKRGTEIAIVSPIFNKKGSMVASIGQKGICLNEPNDKGEIHIKLNNKHYPINFANIKNIKALSLPTNSIR